jgi:hypothetical protein
MMVRGYRPSVPILMIAQPNQKKTISNKKSFNIDPIKPDKLSICPIYFSIHKLLAKVQPERNVRPALIVGVWRRFGL